MSAPSGACGGRHPFANATRLFDGHTWAGVALIRLSLNAAAQEPANPSQAGPQSPVRAPRVGVPA